MNYIVYRIEAIVDKGVFKEDSEDKIMINRNVISDGTYHFNIEDKDIIMALADGVGGENSGEIAAELTLKEISKIEMNYYNIEDKIRTTISNCFDVLIQEAAKNKECRGMATTLTGMAIINEEIITFNIGNSRVYRFRNGAIRQLTEDDSIVQEMINLGVIGKYETSDISNKNVITKYIGSNGQRFEPKIEKHNVKIVVSDIFVICSDGIHDYIDIDVIEQILSEKMSLEEKCINLVDKAKMIEGHDNISVILVEVM